MFKRNKYERNNCASKRRGLRNEGDGMAKMTVEMDTEDAVALAAACMTAAARCKNEENAARLTGIASRLLTGATIALVKENLSRETATVVETNEWDTYLAEREAARAAHPSSGAPKHAA